MGSVQFKNKSPGLRTVNFREPSKPGEAAKALVSKSAGPGGIITLTTDELRWAIADAGAKASLEEYFEPREDEGEREEKKRSRLEELLASSTAPAAPKPSVAPMAPGKPGGVGEGARVPMLKPEGEAVKHEGAKHEGADHGKGDKGTKG